MTDPCYVHYPKAMTKKRTNRSPQKPKTNGRSDMTTAMLLRGGDGIHQNQGEYRRKPKHRARGWDDE